MRGGSMQMQEGGGVEAVVIFDWPTQRIRLCKASKVVHKDSGKQVLLCWPPRWEGRRKTGECFEGSFTAGSWSER